MDIYEKLIRKVAKWMQFDVAYSSAKCYLGTIRAPQWRLVVPNYTPTKDGKFIISRGPIFLPRQYEYTSAKGLLDALLETQYIPLSGTFADESKNKGYLQNIHVKNPFYGFTIDMLKVKLDLIGIE